MATVALSRPTLTGGHGSATPSTAAVITPPTGSNIVILQAETGDVRYTLDGTTPDSSTGFLIVAGSAPVDIYLPTNATLTVYSADGTLQYQFARV